METNSRIAVVRVSRPGLSFGLQKVQVDYNEDEKLMAAEALKKVRENIKYDQHCPQDVDLGVVGYEDFQPQVVEVHKFNTGDNVDQILRSKEEPVKFEVRELKGSLYDLRRELDSIVSDSNFLGIDTLFGQKNTPPSPYSWEALIVYHRKLTPEELANKLSGEETNIPGAQNMANQATYLGMGKPTTTQALENLQARYKPSESINLSED